jgi:hypothetical protein
VLDVLFGFAALLASVGWAASLAPATATRQTDAWLFWGSLIALPCGTAVHLVVHELGHLLAAVAMRLPVVGFRVWWLRLGFRSQPLVGSGGHVRVDLARVRRRVPARMCVLALAGPAANLVAAAATGAIVADTSVPAGVRAAAVGASVAGITMAAMNLLPRRPTTQLETDGLRALRWAFRPDAARATVSAHHSVSLGLAYLASRSAAQP